MRHFLAAGAVPGLASGMVKPAGAAVLIAPASPLEGDPTRMARAGPRAVALSAVADPAQEEELLAGDSSADDQPQRIHALPRSGRGGWTTTTGCAKKGAATRALPRCDAARGSGVVRLRTLTPQRRRRDRSTSTPLASQRPRYEPVANSALFGDRQHLRVPVDGEGAAAYHPAQPRRRGRRAPRGHLRTGLTAGRDGGHGVGKRGQRALISWIEVMIRKPRPPPRRLRVTIHRPRSSCRFSKGRDPFGLNCSKVWDPGT